MAWRAATIGIEAVMAGDLHVGLREYETAVTLFKRSKDQRRALMALNNLGYVQALVGDYEGAEAVVRKVVEDSKGTSLRYSALQNLVQNLGFVLARLGKTSEAEAVLRESARVFREQGENRLEGSSRTYLAEFLREHGKIAEARTEIARALEVLVNAPPLRPWALAVFAQIERENGDVSTARGAILEAMKGIHGVEEGESKIRLELAETLHALGEHAAACDAIASARERVLERAQLISDEERRKSFLERVSDHTRTLALASAWLH
jgi:tetratricopeptide (TPR) repeat protein